jgi:oxalate decarboxylase/phosphoglucose isomerase-like protein (cupin superfamily)
MERKAGYEVKAHMHPEVNRALVGTSEFLYVERGRMKVTVFDEEWAVLAEEELISGEFLLFFRGGHAITMMEDTRLLEVKQGPYPGDIAAKIFRPAA